MDKEKRNKYSKVLLNAYQEGVFKIVWSTSGFSMAVDSKRKEMIPEIKKEDLINSSQILGKYNIKEPTLLNIFTKLKENGITLNCKEVSIDELVKAFKGVVNEKYS